MSEETKRYLVILQRGIAIEAENEDEAHEKAIEPLGYDEEIQMIQEL